MTYLLDTCIISKLRRIKTHPDPQLSKWISKHAESAYFISVLTLGEIQMGIAKLDTKTKERQLQRMILEDWLFGEVVPLFKERILEISVPIAFTWGKLNGEAKKAGKNIPVADGLIAATAMHHSLIVVTENIKDFQSLNVGVINPCQVNVHENLF